MDAWPFNKADDPIEGIECIQGIEGIQESIELFRNRNGVGLIVASAVFVDVVLFCKMKIGNLQFVAYAVILLGAMAIMGIGASMSMSISMSISMSVGSIAVVVKRWIGDYVGDIDGDFLDLLRAVFFDLWAIMLAIEEDEKKEEEEERRPSFRA